MAASPEFYKPSTTPAFSPPQLRAAFPVPQDHDDDASYNSYSSCRTPTGSGITYLREPTTCPPAPRKAPTPPCKKRLFHQQHQEQDKGDVLPVISLRLDDLHRIFRPHKQQQQPADKRRRSARKQQQRKMELEASSPSPSIGV